VTIIEGNQGERKRNYHFQPSILKYRGVSLRGIRGGNTIYLLIQGGNTCVVEQGRKRLRDTLGKEKREEEKEN